MSSSTLSNWDGSQSPRKPPSTPPVPKPPPPHSAATAAKNRTMHLADAARGSSLTLRNASPRSSPRLVHRSSDADEQNVQRMLLESDGPSSPVRTTTKSQGYGSGGARYDTQDIANVSPSKRPDWEAIKKAREGLEKTIEYTEKLTEREYITSNPLLNSLLLDKDGKTPATAISLSSSAASVETDGDQSGSESEDRPDPVACSPSERDPSVVPETPQREAGSLPPSPTPLFIDRESGSPEIEFYEEPGPSRYSDSPEIEVAAGPERGTSAEESTLIDNNAQSPAKSNVMQSPRTPRTARIPPPEILSSPLTEQSSSDISPSHSPNHPTLEKPRERERTDNAFRPNRAYVDLSPLTDSERTKYAPLAKVPFPRRQQLSRTKLRTTDLPFISIPTREQRPPLARHTISLKASSPEAGPSTAVPPAYISNPLSNALVVPEKRKRSWSPSRRPLSKKKRLRIDTDSLASSSEGTATPLKSALMPLELGHSPELAVQDRPERANRSTSSHDRELSRPRTSQVQKAKTQAPGQRTVNNRRKDELFLMGWGDAGNDPLGSCYSYDPAQPLGGDRLCHKRTTSHRVADPAAVQAMLASTLRHLGVHLRDPPQLPVAPWNEANWGHDTHGSDKGKARMIEPDQSQLATPHTPSKSTQQLFVTPARPSDSNVADQLLASGRQDDMLDISSPSRQNEPSTPRPPTSEPPIPSLSTMTSRSTEREPVPSTDLQSAFSAYGRASHGLPYSYPMQDDRLPANAMRPGGTNPFLIRGGPEEVMSMHAELGHHNQFDEAHTNSIFLRASADHSQTMWMPPPEGLDQNQFLDMNVDFSHPTESVIDETAFNSTVGTIDPSLLAGPSNLIRVQTPPLTPPSQYARSSLSSPIVYENSASTKKANPKRTSSGNSTGGRGKGKTSTSRKNSGAGDDDFDMARGGKGKAKGKGKGKERASDVGIRSRPLCITIPASAPPAGKHPDGKRVRKPTARVLEAQASGLLPLPSSVDGRSETQSPRRSRKSPQRDDSSDEDFSDDQARPLSATHPVMELTFCHQCRNTNTYNKMRCVTIRPNGARCGLRYCERCIVNRYENEVEFDHIAINFECPRCRGICNCTTCARRRGETYVPTRKAKRVEPNAYFHSIWQQLRAKKNKKTSRKTQGERQASDDEEEDSPLRQPKRRRFMSSEESDDSSDSSADRTPQIHSSRVQTLSRKRSQSQSKPTETPVLKPKRKTKKQLEEEAKEREILASMALPEGAVWGTVYGLDGTSRIGVGVVADETQRIVLKEGEASAKDVGSSWSTSMNWHDESDDGTVDMEGMESGLQAPWSFSGLPFGDAPSQTSTGISQTLDTLSQAIQSPSTPPRRTPQRNFIGQPRKGWMPRTPPPTLPISPSFANERSPNVRAFVGVLKRAQEKDQAVSIEQAQHLTCVVGELTPEPDDDDDDAYVSMQDPCPAAYEQQAVLPYSEEALNIALMNALSGRQASAPAEFPPPPVVYPLADSTRGDVTSNDAVNPIVVPLAGVAGDVASVANISTDA